MRGSVLLVAASLGLATVGSVLLWAARKITWRRPVPFLRQLEAVSGVPGRSVGPASGISRLDHLSPKEPEDATPDATRDATPDATRGATADGPAVSER